MSNYYKTINLWQRLLNRLFPSRWLEPIKDLEGFADRFIISDVITILDWKDRIRALVSGKVRTTTRIKTDMPVADLVSESVFYVLSPNFPVSARDPT